MKLADTNVLLGLMLADRPQHSALAEAAAGADAARIVITEGVLVETVSVLCWSYGFTRQDAARVLLEALDGPGITAWDRKHADRALRLMAAEPSLGMVDCLLIERGLVTGCEIVSFDRRLCQRASEYVEL
jgi:predicted nucleic-acid-binding protein